MDKKKLIAMIIYCILTTVFVIIFIGVMFITVVEMGYIMSEGDYSTYYIVGAFIGQIFKVIGLLWCLFYLFDHARRYRKELYSKGKTH